MSQGDEGDTANRLDRIHPQAAYLADYAEFLAGGIGAPMIDRSALVSVPGAQVDVGFSADSSFVSADFSGGKSADGLNALAVIGGAGRVLGSAWRWASCLEIEGLRTSPKTGAPND